MKSAVDELMRQKMLLRLEYESEKKEFLSALKDVRIEKLVARGNAWWPVSAGSRGYNSLNQPTLEIVNKTISDEEDKPEGERNDNFEYGKRVAVVKIEDDNNKTILFTAIVSHLRQDRMSLCLDHSINIELNDIPEDKLAVMLSFDETSYQAMVDALDATMRARGRHGELRDLIYSGNKAMEWKLPDMGFSYLDEAQGRAVNKVLRAKDVAIVHGPPGTGKTTTLVEAINETLRRESQVLVCAQSNMAVDWICQKLSERGISVLRLGNPDRVSDAMLANTYERRFSDHPDYPVLWNIRRNIRQIQSSGRKVPDRHQKLDRLRSRATELEIRINNDLLASAHVIASTLVGASHRLLAGLRFSSLFIDEAAQALEAACWIPIRRAGRVILAGDHCQLPPTVKCYEALEGGLGISLMERIVENHPEATAFLNTQYRMNEDIMGFPSKWFYHNKLRAAPDVRSRGILDLDSSIEWLDTSKMIPDEDSLENEYINSESESCRDRKDFFQESFGKEGRSRLNRDEALVTVIALQRYIERIGVKRFIDEKIDIGVISPYKAQVSYLRHLVKKISFFKQVRKRITINTIDAFQGQERDVIIVSLVRSNSYGQIGFLNDLRRINVAMTRSRMKLILIGNAQTLSRHRFYKELLEYISMKS